MKKLDFRESQMGYHRCKKEIKSSNRNQILDDGKIRVSKDRQNIVQTHNPFPISFQIS